MYIPIAAICPGRHESYLNRPCDLDCSNLDEKCNDPSKPSKDGCFCNIGFARDYKGVCIRLAECPRKCKLNMFTYHFFRWSEIKLGFQKNLVRVILMRIMNNAMSLARGRVKNWMVIPIVFLGAQDKVDAFAIQDLWKTNSIIVLHRKNAVFNRELRRNSKVLIFCIFGF